MGKEWADTGDQMYQLASELFPICRSITGEGIRTTLRRIGEMIPLGMHAVQSGTQVFDWTVPKEWNIRDAYIKDRTGRRVVDFRQNNLQVVNYSVPFQGTIGLDQLQEHLFSLPEKPDWIPYRTSYYKESWGFCLSHRQRLALCEPEYEVCIDSILEDGVLSYGEFYLPGEQEEEVLISAHTCHPSLANDNLSGVTVAAFLGQFLRRQKRRYSYRILFIPGTIGAITWLAQNQAAALKVRHGLVLTCVGDAGGFHYKKSRRGEAEIDRVMLHVLQNSDEPFAMEEFSPYGYDERQYCSPGFNLPVGCLMRSVWGTFPEYHTSADNLSFIHPEKLGQSLRVCTAMVEVLEGNRCYRNQNPYCEPQLGRRGLYGAIVDEEIHARLWVLNLSDGQHSLLDIAERSKLPFEMICEAADLLRAGGLLAEAESRSGMRQ